MVLLSAASHVYLVKPTDPYKVYDLTRIYVDPISARPRRRYTILLFIAYKAICPHGAYTSTEYRRLVRFSDTIFAPQCEQLILVIPSLS